MQNQDTQVKQDITARAYRFGLNTIRLTDKLPNKRSAWIITDQLIRAATSVGANLVEGKAASSRLEFKRFYEISLKSAKESTYWLQLLKDTELAKEVDLKPLSEESIELSKMLARGVLKLKGKF